MRAMLQNRLFSTLRTAIIVAALTLCSLSTASQEIIYLSETPVLCNRGHIFRLKEVLPDGYVYYYKYNNDSSEIVLTRDKERVNRYTSKFPQKPYIMSCDYQVRKLGETVTMIACLAQYQEENPFYVLFAADSQEAYCEQWNERIKNAANTTDWIFSIPIDSDFIYEIGIDRLTQMRSRLEQVAQRNELIRFNINQLNMAVNSFDEGDCEAN